jgi:hypothetical protein
MLTQLKMLPGRVIELHAIITNPEDRLCIPLQAGDEKGRVDNPPLRSGVQRYGNGGDQRLFGGIIQHFCPKGFQRNATGFVI